MSTIEDFAWRVGKGLRTTVDSVNEIIDGSSDDKNRESKTTFRGLENTEHTIKTYIPTDDEGDKDRAIRIDMADGTQTIWAIHEDQRSHDALKVMGQVLLNGLEKKDNENSSTFTIDLTGYGKSEEPAIAVLQYVNNGKAKSIKSMAILSVIHHVNEKPVTKMSSDDLYVPYNPYVNGKYGRGNWPWPIEDRSKYKYAPRGFR